MKKSEVMPYELIGYNFLDILFREKSLWTQGMKHAAFSIRFPRAATDKIANTRLIPRNHSRLSTRILTG